MMTIGTVVVYRYMDDAFLLRTNMRLHEYARFFSLDVIYRFQLKT